MPLILNPPDDYIEIIFNAGLIGQNLLEIYHHEEDFQSLQEKWYEFEEITSTIEPFFHLGFEDEEFQEFWLSDFMEENLDELNTIRSMIQEEEDNKTIVLDDCNILEEVEDCEVF